MDSGTDLQVSLGWPDLLHCFTRNVKMTCFISGPSVSHLLHLPSTARKVLLGYNSNPRPLRLPPHKLIDSRLAEGSIAEPS